MTLLEILDWSLIGTFEATVAFVGYMVVFLVLVLLTIVFVNIPNLIYYDYKKLFNKKAKSTTGDEVAQASVKPSVTGETNAAIGMAIYLYFNELHDKESNIVTINKVERRYSPWSSKIYGLNKFERR